MRAINFLAVLLVLGGLSACGEVTNSNTTGKPDLQQLQRAAGIDIALSEVIDTYVLGSKHTDIQRERLTEKLVGSTVDWTLTVYEVSKDGDRYTVTSDLVSSAKSSGGGALAVIAYVYPRNNADIEAIEHLMTGNQIKLKGVVHSINLRTAIVLHPSVVSN